MSIRYNIDKSINTPQWTKMEIHGFPGRKWYTVGGSLLEPKDWAGSLRTTQIWSAEPPVQMLMVEAAISSMVEWDL